MLASFTDWSLLTPPKWIGFGNYVKMWRDPLFFVALWNSLCFGVGSVGLGLIVSFLLALLLNQKLKGNLLFSIAVLLPWAVPALAASAIWKWLFDSRYGFVNAFNPMTNWYDADVIGIDTGITLLMAENLRTGFVWNTFMKNAAVQRALERAGFESYGS